MKEGLKEWDKVLRAAQRVRLPHSQATNVIAVAAASAFNSQFATTPRAPYPIRSLPKPSKTSGVAVLTTPVLGTATPSTPGMVQVSAAQFDALAAKVNLLTSIVRVRHVRFMQGTQLVRLWGTEPMPFNSLLMLLSSFVHEDVPHHTRL